MSNIKVLIVDDTPDMRMVVGKILKQYNFPYDEAATGEEALQKIKNDIELKLVLLDLNLPDIDGITLMQRMIEVRMERDIKVCVISGKRDRETVSRAVQNGANDYLVKPIYPEALIAKINSLYQLGTAADQYNQILTNLKAKLNNTFIIPDIQISTVSEIGLALQCSTAFTLQSQLELSCELLSAATGLAPVFHCRVVNCIKLGFGKYNVMANFIGLPEDVATKIRALAIRGEKLTDHTVEKRTDS